MKWIQNLCGGLTHSKKLPAVPALDQPNDGGAFPNSSPVLSSAAKHISDFWKAKNDCRGLALNFFSRFVLTPDMGPQAIPSGVYGPLPQGTVWLPLSHSSLTLKGPQVLHGVTDADYIGGIKVMVQNIQNTVQVTVDSCIAQLIILPLTKLAKSVRKEDPTVSGLQMLTGFNRLNRISQNRIYYWRKNIQRTLRCRCKCFRYCPTLLAYGMALECSNYRSIGGRQYLPP